MKVLKIALLALLLCAFAAPSIAPNAFAKSKSYDDEEEIAVLLVSPVFKGSFKEDDEDEINQNFYNALRKREGYEIYTYKSLKDIIDSSEKIKEIKKCETKGKCLVAAAKGTGLKFVVSGMFTLTDEDSVAVKMVVFDLKKGEIVNKIDETFDTVRESRSKKNLGSLCKLLLPDPEELSASKEEEEETPKAKAKDKKKAAEEDEEETPKKKAKEKKKTAEEDEEEPAPKKKAKKASDDEDENVDVSTGPKANAKVKPNVAPGPKRYTPEQVKNEVRESLKLAISGRPDDAIARLNKMKSGMRCECNEDARVSDCLNWLQELVAAEENVKTGTEKKSPKILLAAAEKIESILAALDAEILNLKLQGKMATRADLKMARAEGFYLKGNMEEDKEDFLEAVESWKKALEYYPAHKEAAAKLKDLSPMCKRLLAKVKTMMTYDAEGAKKKLDMVFKLVKDENDPIHQQALELKQEIEDYESE